MRKLIGIFAVLASFLVFSISALAAFPSPEDQVRETVDGVMKALNNQTLSDDQRHDEISSLIGERFNFQAMGQTILATNWKKASAEQRERFINAFRKLLENTYVVSVESYQGETVRIAKEKVSGKHATVNTFIVQPSREIPVTYKFKQAKDGSWYAYDVVIEGVSMISNYRSSFRSMVAREGMDGLLTKLEAKVAKKN